MNQHFPCVYILTNKPHGVLYTGVTSNLPSRVWQHKNRLIDGFSCKYNTDKLVWYEMHSEIYAAITREKQIKRWHRDWKIELIESMNPAWTDRFEEILG